MAASVRIPAFTPTASSSSKYGWCRVNEVSSYLSLMNDQTSRLMGNANCCIVLICFRYLTRRYCSGVTEILEYGCCCSSPGRIYTCTNRTRIYPCFCERFLILCLWQFRRSSHQPCADLGQLTWRCSLYVLSVGGTAKSASQTKTRSTAAPRPGIRESCSYVHRKMEILSSFTWILYQTHSTFFCGAQKEKCLMYCSFPCNESEQKNVNHHTLSFHLKK